MQTELNRYDDKFLLEIRRELHWIREEMKENRYPLWHHYAGKDAHYIKEEQGRYHRINVTKPKKRIRE